MPTSDFDLLASNSPAQIEGKLALGGRPCLARQRSHEDEAPRFVPGDELAVAINCALCVGDPLLVTGDPGTGKTQAAYYIAWKLKLGEVLHFQVRSVSQARDLLYSFDTVQYFHEANVKGGSPGPLDKKKFRKKEVLWEAIASAQEEGKPRVVLIDEIDKAPRDFPNDLLHELDQMRITCPETGEQVVAESKNRPIVVITSNSERRLPEPFLRRCVYHHIEFTPAWLDQILESRKEEFQSLGDGVVRVAMDKFLSLREKGLRKIPSTAEFLVWLRVLAGAGGIEAATLQNLDLSRLPYLGALVKDHGDLKDVRTGKGQR